MIVLRKKFSICKWNTDEIRVILLSICDMADSNRMSGLVEPKIVADPDICPKNKDRVSFRLWTRDSKVGNNYSPTRSFPIFVEVGK